MVVTSSSSSSRWAELVDTKSPSTRGTKEKATVTTEEAEVVTKVVEEAASKDTTTTIEVGDIKDIIRIPTIKKTSIKAVDSR